MAISVEKQPNEPIVLVRFLNPFNVREDIPAVAKQLSELFDNATEPIWDITDARDLQIPFGDMVAGLAMMTRGELASVNHKNAAGFVIIANSTLIKLGGQALSQAQYGNVKSVVFESEKDAFDYVRDRIQKTKAVAA